MSSSTSSSFINITRGHELAFTGTPGQSASAKMIVKNISSNHIGIKITADHPQDYRIFPDVWIVEPGHEYGILILLKTMPDLKDGQGSSTPHFLDVKSIRLENASVSRKQIWSDLPADTDVQTIRVKTRFEPSQHGKKEKRSQFMSTLVRMKWVVIGFIVLVSIGLIMCLMNCVSQFQVCKAKSSLKSSL